MLVGASTLGISYMQTRPLIKAMQTSYSRRLTVCGPIQSRFSFRVRLFLFFFLIIVNVCGCICIHIFRERERTKSGLVLRFLIFVFGYIIYLKSTSSIFRYTPLFLGETKATTYTSHDKIYFRQIQAKTNNSNSL
jgi:hypothetical protein